MTGDKPVEIADIQPHVVRRDLAAPAWTYTPVNGCGPTPQERVFRFNLDTPTWTDAGIVKTGGIVVANSPSAALGPAFLLTTPTDHKVIRVDATSCHGNYEWTLEVKYIPTGDSKIESVTLGPYDSYGSANNTISYTAGQTATGSLQIQNKETISGPPLVCKNMIAPSATASRLATSPAPTAAQAGQSFYGRWHVHGTSYLFTADGAGSITSHDGFTPSGKWVDEVDQVSTVLSPDAHELTVKVVRVSWQSYDSAGRPMPTPNPYPGIDTRLGEQSTLRFVHPDVLISAPVPPAKQGIGNPYLCGANVAPEYQRLCGA